MVAEEHHTELHQQISNLITSGVLGLDVSVEVPQHYRLLVPEACQGIHQVQEVLQGECREVLYDNRGLLVPLCTVSYGTIPIPSYMGGLVLTYRRFLHPSMGKPHSSPSDTSPY